MIFFNVFIHKPLPYVIPNTIYDGPVYFLCQQRGQASCHQVILCLSVTHKLYLLTSVHTHTHKQLSVNT